MENQLDKAVEVLKMGGVVIFPTDTVWGMGVAADNLAAVKKFYKIKKREANKPTAILVADLGQAEKLGVFNARTRQLASKYWPGALTIIVLSKRERTVGLRVPDFPLVQELCRRAGAILAGSANFAGERAPMKKEGINPELVKLVDMMMEGECGGPFDGAQGKQASTVIDTTVEPWRVVRQGSVKVE